MDALSSLTAATFRDRVGEGFATEPDGPVLELAEVVEQPQHAAPGSGRTPFALLFRGPADRPLPQGTQPLRHAELGELALFLVPVGSGPDGMRYEAVFS